MGSTTTSERRTATDARDAAVHAKAVELVRLSLEMTARAGSGHPTSAASLAHLVTLLLYDWMRWDPRQPDRAGSDRLVLSEGHACPIVYAAGADLSVPIGPERRPMTVEDAMTLRSIDSPVDGHPNPVLGFPLFPAATGSLGQGLSIAAGLALGARLDGLGSRVYCLIGDGESREGQVWEALDLVVDQRLRSVCPIFNANGFGQSGPVSGQQSAPALAQKLRAFGLEPLVIDGHDPAEIRDALERHAEACAAGERPVALVARTVKGWGSPSLASQKSGKHGKPAEGEELAHALVELDETAQRVGARWSDGVLQVREVPEREAVPPRTAGDPPSLDALLEETGQAEKVRRERAMATRDAYGLGLLALGRTRPDVVVLDGDVSGSTHAATFTEDDDLRRRFVECRIAEQNMVSCAAGLAAAGKTPFASTFGKFLTRAYDQIEMALVSDLPVRLVGSHVGVTLAADGPSQMALPDVAWFAAWGRVRRRGHPLLHVLTPADAYAAYALTLAMGEPESGPAYLRTLRPDVPLLYDARTRFPFGGHRVVREGGPVLVLASGYMVHEALRAALSLEEAGLGASVVDLYSLPFDEDPIVDLARRHGGRVLTLEDNYGGALGAAVAEALAGLVPGLQLRRMFVQRVPKSGREPEDVLEYVALSAERIADAVRELADASGVGRA